MSDPAAPPPEPAAAGAVGARFPTESRHLAAPLFPTSPRLPAAPLLLATLTAVSPLLFALLTGQAWEDFFITFRHSVNLIEGHGLTYQAGERIQGFSSPLAVLLGAFAALVSGGSVTGAIWILRLLGAAAFGAAAWFLCAVCGAGDRGRVSGATLLALLSFALESKSVAFAANGMETPYFVLFLAGSLWAMTAHPASGPLWGLFWAGLLWARPDGCVYIFLLATACLVFRDRPVRETLPTLLKAAGTCAAIYAPWFLFAWGYYGSPVPQSVVAKGAGYVATLGPGRLWEILRDLPSFLPLVFLPPYAQQGGWTAFEALGLVLGLAGTLLWLLPGTGRPARRASFTAFGAVIYLAAIDLKAPWYLPPIFVLAIVPLQDLFRRLAARLRAAPAALRAAGIAAGVILAGGFAYLWIDYARVARVTTELNEEKNRREIGLWLKANAGGGDRVFLECPGIIGFYSGLRMLDYPGLVSPEVSDLVRSRGRGIARAALALEPEWLVLRPIEFRMLRTIGEEEFRRRYAVVRVFDQSALLRERLPGRQAVLYDSIFIVLRRRAPGEEPQTQTAPDVP